MTSARDRHNESIERLEAVRAEDPDSVDALFSLAVAVQQSGRLIKAERLYQEIIRLDPNIPAVYLNLAEINSSLRRLEQAEGNLLKAIDLEPGLAQAHNKLGIICFMTGRREDAIASYRNAIACDPMSFDAYQNLAIAKQHDEYDEETRTMERLYDSLRESERGRIALGFGLARIFDELGECDKAFRLWNDSNRLLRERFPYQVADVISEMDAVRAQDIAYRVDDGLSRMIYPSTPIFIVGMPRSGTSLVEQVLASHSAVFGAGELSAFKRFLTAAAPDFPRGTAGLSSRDWQAVGEAYLKAIAGLSGASEYVTDKMPSNFQLLGAIRRAAPRAIVIHCRRDPLDTIFSCYKQRFTDPDYGYCNHLDDLAKYYESYLELMGHWKDLYPGWILDVKYEDVVTSFEVTVRRILEHCGLEFESGVLSFYENRRAVATASGLQVRKPVYRSSVGAWKRYAEHLDPLLAQMSTLQN